MRRDENRFKRGAGGKKGNKQRGESLDLSSCCDRLGQPRWGAAAYLMAVCFSLPLFVSSDFLMSSKRFASS